jgi:hypothetical protein
MEALYYNIVKLYCIIIEINIIVGVFGINNEENTANAENRTNKIGPHPSRFNCFHKNIKYVLYSRHGHLKPILFLKLNF